MSLKIKEDNINYVAKVVKMPELREHPNADRLALVIIQGQTIITGKDAEVNSLYILFQLESKINEEFLSYINGFSDSEHNRNKEIKGFFAYKNCRVRATRLRGILSEGYLHPVKDFNLFLESKGIRYEIGEKDLNVEFDSVGDFKLVEKYINRETLRKPANRERNKKGGKVKRESRLVDNQFRLSPDYRQLKREIHTVNPEDWIEITSKWHGANGVIAKVLTRRKLSIIEKIAKKLGVKVRDEEYGLVFSSRRVIKNEFADQKTNDYYNSNVWEIVAKKYSVCLKNGISLVGEVVGFTPTGRGIQGLYDYGCKPNECDFIIFRITYTSISGDVYEFSLQQVVDYCNKYGLKHIPIYYIGVAKGKYPELKLDEHWHENFLEKLKEEYLEKECQYCINKVTDEGVVLSKRVGGFEGLKLKSVAFLLQETKDLDKGDANIEDDS